MPTIASLAVTGEPSAMVRCAYGDDVRNTRIRGVGAQPCARRKSPHAVTYQNWSQASCALQTRDGLVNLCGVGVDGAKYRHEIKRHEWTPFGIQRVQPRRPQPAVA